MTQSGICCLTTLLLLTAVAPGYAQQPVASFYYDERGSVTRQEQDTNRDGKMDVLAAAGDSVRAMLGDGHGGFAAGPATPTGRGAWRLDLADLNGDGKIDVVTSNGESNSVSVLLGK